MAELYESAQYLLLLTTSTSDIAVKFANYVSENYIDVDSKFAPMPWSQAPDVSAFTLRSSEVVDFRTNRKRVYRTS